MPEPEFWTRLSELQGRLPERDLASRKALIITAIGSSQARQNPWKAFSKIEGESDFYSAMNSNIEVSKSLQSLRQYLVHLSREILGHPADVTWIQSQIQRIEQEIAQEAIAMENPPPRSSVQGEKRPIQKPSGKPTSNQPNDAGRKRREKPDVLPRNTVSAKSNHGINTHAITVHGDLVIQHSHGPLTQNGNDPQNNRQTPHSVLTTEAESALDRSHSAPAAPSPAPNLRHPIRECLKSVLNSDIELAQRMCETLFGPQSPVDTNQIAQRLLQLDDPTTAKNKDFPLAEFCNVLTRWCDGRTRCRDGRLIRLPAKTCQRSLRIFTQLLMIESFPKGDREMVETAMLATRAAPPNHVELHVGTRDRDLVEKLLVETFLRIANQPDAESGLLQLLDPDFKENPEASPIFGKLKVLSEPTNPPDHCTMKDWYAEMCLQALGHDLRQPDDWVAAFRNRLSRFADHGVVVALFIAREKEVAIKVLRQEFPQLLLVVLAEKDIERYTQIYMELDDIDKALKYVLIQSET